MFLAIFLLTLPLTPEESLFFDKTHAQNLFEAQLYEKAVPLYQNLIREDESLYPYLVEALYHTEKYDALIDLLGKKGNLSAQELYFLGMAFQKLGSKEKALATLQEAYQKNKNNFKIKYQLGLAQIENQAYIEAEKIFTSLLEINDSNVKVLSLIQLFHLERRKEHFENAFDYLKRAHALNAGNISLEYEFDYLFGTLFYAQRHFENASEYFLKALSQKNPQKSFWYADTLLMLGNAYRQLAENGSSEKMRKDYLNKAIEIFLNLQNSHPSEPSTLLLGQTYLEFGHHFHDSSALQKGDKILSRQDLITSQKGMSEALLMRAMAKANYAERDAFYRNFTQELNSASPLYGKGWYLRGLNDFEQGKQEAAQGNSQQAEQFFQQAQLFFQRANVLLQNENLPLAALALKYQALTLASSKQPENLLKAQDFLKTLIDSPSLLNSLPHPDEPFYLLASLLFYQFEKEKQSENADKIIQTLERGLHSYEKGVFKDRSLQLLGTVYYHLENFEKAENTFLSIPEKCKDSDLIPLAYLWAARACDKKGNKESGGAYREKVYQDYPTSSYAPEAFFFKYTYEEYLQGNRQAVKHLNDMVVKFPNSHFSIYSWFLIGLDLKRDRKTEEGKWLSKKNLIASIEAFQAAESLFDLLAADLDKKELDPLLALRYRASLEKALTNLEVVDQSEETKKQIYLNYAEAAFQQLRNELLDPLTPHYDLLQKLKTYRSLVAEVTYWLGQVSIKRGLDPAAEQLYDDLIEKYRLDKITRGYYLSKMLFEKGLIEMRKNNHLKALELFSEAEERGNGGILSEDQRLEIWLEQSRCCQALGQLDNAILLLSKAVNHDAISSLRIKAMYLRAEIYEKQGKMELARRQLESASKKGGEWALKAKEKLVKDYGY